MGSRDVAQAAALVSRTMNPDEGRYALETLRNHVRGQKLGVHDGRALYVLTNAAAVAGLVGLHFYVWGPPENVWLSWFALDPHLHGRGLGTRLLQAAMNEARHQHHMKLFVETYSTPEFARARAFYLARGFTKVGTVRSYLPNGGSMVVFYKSLASIS